MYAVAEGELPIQNVQLSSQAEAGASSCESAWRPSRKRMVSSHNPMPELTGAVLARNRAHEGQRLVSAKLAASVCQLTAQGGAIGLRPWHSTVSSKSRLIQQTPAKHIERAVSCRDICELTGPDHLCGELEGFQVS